MQEREYAMKRLMDPTMFKFLLVGVFNTLVGCGTMFLLYNLAGCSYWLSSAANYIVGGVVSFFLNKYFTFQNHERSWKQVIRFAVNVAVCYLLAYGIAKPAVGWVLGNMAFSEQMKGNLTMLAGSGLFVLFNCFVQKFFAFRQKG